MLANRHEMNRIHSGESENGRPKAGPLISSSFLDYKPPFDPTPIAQRMVDSVPEKYLGGLSRVVLTNARSLSRERRRSVTKARGRKVRVIETRGLYHPAFNGNRAWIEIFIDNTLRKWEKSGWLLVPLIRENLIGDVLFHEIGHHIHLTCRPEHREKEDVADIWKVRLQKNYSKSHFRWLRRIGRLIRLLLGPLMDRQHENLGKQMLSDGHISRAEFEESMRATKPGERLFPE